MEITTVLIATWRYAMGKSQQQKGRRFEATLAAYLQDAGYLGVRPGRALSFGDEPDLVGLPYVHAECKHVEKLNIMEAMEQAQRDAEKFGDGMPVVFHKRNYKPTLATMLLDDYLEMYECYVAVKSREDEDGRELYQDM